MSWAAGAVLGGLGWRGGLREALASPRGNQGDCTRDRTTRGLAGGCSLPLGRLLYATPAAIVLRWGLRCEAYRDFLDKLRESKEVAPEWENACFAILYSFHSTGLYYKHLQYAGCQGPSGEASGNIQVLVELTDIVNNICTNKLNCICDSCFLP